MPAPDDRTYLQTHEWHKAEADGTVTLGISQFAVDELTDITYVEVKPAAGERVTAGEAFGEVESVKATSDLYCGIDGEVVEVNGEVIDNPALINEDPYGRGWLIRVRPADDDQAGGLLAAGEYDRMHA